MGFDGNIDPGVLLPASVGNASRALALNVFNYGAKGDGVTDDTEAVQAAITAASGIAYNTNSLTDIWLPPGAGFYLGPLTPADNVRLWCYGATMIANDSAIGSGSWIQSTGVLNQFAIRGGSWIGGGAESGHFFVGSNYYNENDLLFQDMYINGWGGPLFYVQGCQRVRILDNTAVNLTTSFGDNYINIDPVPSQGEQEVADSIVRGNTIIGAAGGGCVAVFAHQSSAFAARVLIEGNILQAEGANAGVIDFEGNVTGSALSQFIVANNLARAVHSGGGGNCVVIEEGFGDITVHSNTLDASACSNGGGIAVPTAPNGPILLMNNRIIVPSGDAAMSFPSGSLTNITRHGNVLSTGPSQGVATLVAGTVTVNTAEVLAADAGFFPADNILLSRQVTGGTVGELTVGTITSRTSFAINSSSSTDTSTVYWEIRH